MIKQTIEEKIREKFAPFICYRASNTMVSLEKEADVQVHQLEHCEQELLDFITSEVQKVREEERNSTREMIKQVIKKLESVSGKTGFNQGGMAMAESILEELSLLQ